MWMVECNDHSKDLKISTDSRKLRPLAARSCSSNGGIQQSRHAFSTLLTTPPSCSCFQNPNIHSWNLLSGVKREINMGSVPLVSSRWNPTPEQLQALEEMYRRGLRTPTAEQIQQIASKLRRFGKIEGKNVFYWFQNHKARERQKKRRQLELLPATAKKMRHLETKPTGLDRRSFEIGHPKKLPTISSCTTPNSQDSESMHGAVIADCRHDGWIPFNQKELQQKIITTEKNENYLQLDLSSLMPPNYSNSTAHKTTAERGLGQGNKNQFGALSLSINDDLRNFESGTKQNQTLQLFPVKGHDLITTLNGFELQEESNQNVSTDPTKFAAKEFIEFLPTRC